jgi:hypothetical protein
MLLWVLVVVRRSTGEPGQDWLDVRSARNPYGLAGR